MGTITDHVRLIFYFHQNDQMQLKRFLLKIVIFLFPGEFSNSTFPRKVLTHNSTTYFIFTKYNYFQKIIILYSFDIFYINKNILLIPFFIQEFDKLSHQSVDT